MSEEQLSWFFSELSQFSEYSLVIWVSSRPWIGKAEPGDDFWGGYPSSRSQISNFISDNSINNLLMLAGDAHMLAIDDGSNSDYRTNTTRSGAGFPVFQAAPIDRMGSIKGGPFSHGCFTYTASWTEQFGVMEITEIIAEPGSSESNSTCITWTGYRTFTSPSSEVSLVTYHTCAPTVKKGNPGSGTCYAEIIPFNYWLLLGISYGIAAILFLVSIVGFRRMIHVDKRGILRRAATMAVFALAYVMTVVIVPLAMVVRPLGSYVYRPAFLPVDIGWVVAVLDFLFLVLMLVEYFFSKKNVFTEEENFYLKLK